MSTVLLWTDDNEGDSDTPLCGRCYDRYYTTCADCGRTIHQDDAYYAQSLYQGRSAGGECVFALEAK